MSRRATLALAGVISLVLAVGLWWGVWTGDPRTQASCGCGDTSLILWFLEWPAYAVRHGANPFFSTLLFHPQGINLLDNTSSLAVGWVLLPVTLLFGPVATLNVAVTLAPVATTLAMCTLLLRWVRRPWTAVLGGLLYAFSPFAVVNLAGSHLMLGVLVVPPLIAGRLDELLVRRRHPPWRTGSALGALLVVQFLIGSEVLAVILVACIPLLLAKSVRTAHTLRGLGAAAIVGAALGGIPVGFALLGPAHLRGAVWPTLPVGSGGLSPGDLWWPHRTSAAAVSLMRLTGGYEGRALPSIGYIGVPALGLALWRRHWWILGIGFWTALLSFGNRSLWTPFRILDRIPLVSNIIPGRFIVITDLCAALAVALAVDAMEVRWRQVTATGLTLASIVWVLAPNLSLTTEAVTVPPWFVTADGGVVLAYPSFGLQQSAEDWQAIGGDRFALVGGSGPDGTLTRAGRERRAVEILGRLSFTPGGFPAPTRDELDEVGRALRGWGVTTVVVPDPTGLPRYEQGTDPAAALALFTLVEGRRPVRRHDAWVWHGRGRLRHISAGRFTDCTLRPLGDVPECVL